MRPPRTPARLSRARGRGKQMAWERRKTAPAAGTPPAATGVTELAHEYTEAVPDFKLEKCRLDGCN